MIATNVITPTMPGPFFIFLSSKDCPATGVATDDILYPPEIYLSNGTKARFRECEFGMNGIMNIL
jgi:hypothetical protein